jgi:hypothetical protein
VHQAKGIIIRENRRLSAPTHSVEHVSAIEMHRVTEERLANDLRPAGMSAKMQPPGPKPQLTSVGPKSDDPDSPAQSSAHARRAVMVRWSAIRLEKAVKDRKAS